MAPTGLTITQFSVLRSLVLEPSQPLSRLAEAKVMDRTSLYRLIAPLEAQGLMSITPGRGRHGRIAEITPAGRDAVRRATPVWEAAQSEFFQRFDVELWSKLEALLGEATTTSAEIVAR